MFNLIDLNSCVFCILPLNVIFFSFQNSNVFSFCPSNPMISLFEFRRLILICFSIEYFGFSKNNVKFQLDFEMFVVFSSWYISSLFGFIFNNPEDVLNDWLLLVGFSWVRLFD